MSYERSTILVEMKNVSLPIKTVDTGREWQKGARQWKVIVLVNSRLVYIAVALCEGRKYPSYLEPRVTPCFGGHVVAKKERARSDTFVYAPPFPMRW